MNEKPRSAGCAKSGVDLDAGEAFGSFTGDICRESYGNSPYVMVKDWSRGHFCGPRPYHFVSLPPGCYNMTAPHGIDTETIPIAAANMCRGVASNLLEMTGLNIVRWGGLPLVLVNRLEVKTLGKPGDHIYSQYQDMMRGLAEMAKEQKYVLINGETAQMGDYVSSEWSGDDLKKMPVFNWGAVMHGVINREKRIDGSTLTVGQHVIALRDSLRSNGASKCRSYLRQVYGPRWFENDGAREVVSAMAQPCALYSRFLATMNGWYNPTFTTEIKVHAIADLSGGGIRSKFVEGILRPHGLHATLHDLWDPPSFMRDCVSHFHMDDEETHTVFNGGQGALVVVDEVDVENFCDQARHFGVETQDAGVITMRKAGSGSALIVSKFSGKEFVITG